MQNNEKIIAIVGPTAVGKSALAIKVAKELSGEIISCDSMQIYRGMDIGTAKPDREEQREIKHHLIDVKDPSEAFSCADYAILAKECINDIRKRGKPVIFCGGTGLYLDSVLEIPSFCDTARDDDYRKELEETAKEKGVEYLHFMLEKVDKESAEKIHANNVKRVIRALEIYKCTNVPKSELDKKSKEQKPPYEKEVFFLTYRNKELLYKRIEDRVDQMINDGLVEEVRRLVLSGDFVNSKTASGAIGYKELIPYVNGEDTLENCVERLKTSTRHYAKRQLTWFSAKEGYHTVYVDESDAFSFVMSVVGGENG